MTTNEAHAEPAPVPIDQLGGFLRARRGAATLDSVGLRDVRPRRVSGLRREELAEAAAVSLTYYTPGSSRDS